MSELNKPQVFHEDWTGDDNDPWDSNDWGTDTTGGGIAEILDNKGRLFHEGDSSGSGHARGKTTFDIFAPCEVLLKTSIDGNGGNTRLMVEFLTDDDVQVGWRSDEGYIVEFRDPDEVLLVKRENGSTTLDSATISTDYLEGTTFWIRADVDEDGNIKVWLWRNGSNEPETPTLSATDDTYSQGRFSISASNFENSDGIENLNEELWIGQGINLDFPPVTLLDGTAIQFAKVTFYAYDDMDKNGKVELETVDTDVDGIPTLTVAVPAGKLLYYEGHYHDGGTFYKIDGRFLTHTF